MILKPIEMDGLSEDDSSDSSSEYLVDPDKINLNSSFFTEKSKVATIKNDSEDESTDDENLDDVSQTNNIELFTQVLKNLEYTQKLEVNDEQTEKEQLHADYSMSQKKEEKVQKIKSKEQNTTSSNEIDELLLQGESSSCKRSPKHKIVKNDENIEPPNEYTIPKDGVKIVLPGSSLIMNKRKKGKQDVKAILRKRLRTSQILVEKVGLLCWLAYGFHLNHQLNQPEIMTGVLSLISTSNYPKDRIDLSYLEKFTIWFKQLFTFDFIETNANKQINKETLLKILKEKKISNYKELVLLYIATLRALGLNCRLVISLCPPHRIFSDSPLFKSDVKGQETKSKNKSNVTKKQISKEKEISDKTSVIQNSLEAKKNANLEAKKKAAEILRSKLQSNTKKSRSDTDKDTNIENMVTQKLSPKKVKKRDESKSVDHEKNMSNLRQLRSRKININSEDNKTIKLTDLTSKTDGTKSKYYIEESTDSEAEFQPKPKRVMKKNLNNVNEKTSQSSTSTKKNNRKLLSSDSENEEVNKTKKKQDIWAEIYLESEESWICASVIDEKIHCVSEIYVSNLQLKLCYIYEHIIAIICFYYRKKQQSLYYM